MFDEINQSQKDYFWQSIISTRMRCSKNIIEAYFFFKLQNIFKKVGDIIACVVIRIIHPASPCRDLSQLYLRCSATEALLLNGSDG